MKVLEKGTVTSPKGFLAGTAEAAIKKPGKLDVSLVYSTTDCTASGVFTKSQVVAAPVTTDRKTLAGNSTAMRAVFTNSGNANAATGEVGLANAQQMQKLAAEGLGCAAQQVLVLSTGVIGVQLPMDRIATGVAEAAQNMSADHGTQAAEAICTTDTFIKQYGVEIPLSTGTVTIGGMAKGAGMIHPDMATMLGVMTTDAALEADLLREMLQTASDVSFNCISVDGDTSTNDTVLLLANGASGVTIDRQNREEGSDYDLFYQGLTHICTELAKLIVRDGEGASKFIELHVSGTRDKAEAHQIANTIAVSPLVKTAFAGSDANWGRIMMAAGRAGVNFDQYKTTLRIGNDGESWLTLLEAGLPTGYLEEDAAAIFAKRDIHVWLELGEGTASATVWTCDLTHEYVTINADYRT